jgi:hypothetical protein
MVGASSSRLSALGAGDELLAGRRCRPSVILSTTSSRGVAEHALGPDVQELDDALLASVAMLEKLALLQDGVLQRAGLEQRLSARDVGDAVVGANVEVESRRALGMKEGHAAGRATSRAPLQRDPRDARRRGGAGGARPPGRRVGALCSAS